MTRPAAVLFDCDGVIIDSEGPVLRLLRDDLARHGLDLTIHQLETDYVGGTVEVIAGKLRAQGVALPDSWVTDFYAQMDALLGQGVALIPGVVSVFDALDRAGIPYAVGSNGTLHKMQITLGPHGLLPRFRAVLSGQALGRPKPAPDVYLAAAAACGQAPADCVVIEDSPTGARAAIAAGMRCFGYAAHGPDHAQAQGLAELAVPMFADMADLPGLLGL